MNKEKILISIITPVYNAQDFLAATLCSVEKQTYKNWEQLLIIDKNSKDNSLQIAIDFSKKDSRFKVFQNTDLGGVAANRNLGIRNSHGQYIAFLDADDLWLPNKLELQLNDMLQKEIDFSFHDYECIDMNGQKTGRQVKALKQSVRYEELLAYNEIGCLTVMILKSRLINHSFYNGNHEDFCLWLDLLKSGKPAYHLTQSLALYRLLQSSRSGNKVAAAKWRWDILRNREHIGFFKSLQLMFIYLKRSLYKRVPS
jgi:teichuronic acid biosynthesis glycosyltransferase TuaG